MRIAFDANLASFTIGGLGAYIVHLVPELVKLGQDSFTALTPEKPPILRDLPEQSNLFRIDAASAGANTPTGFYESRVGWEQDRLADELRRLAPDVFWGPAFMAPLGWVGPKVVTIHDLIFEQGEEYNSPASRTYYRTWARASAEAAQVLLVNSTSTANDLAEIWNMRDKPVVKAPLAPALAFIPTDTVASREIVHRALGVDGPYILFVGNAFPRKNLARLLDAYRLLPKSLVASVKLVLLTTPDAELMRLIRAKGVEGAVTITGYCSRSLMPHLYAAAELLAYPSLFEGFGLPPLEAMATGTAVVTSRAGALPETVGDAALLVDPRDVAEIAAAMERVLDDEALREHLETAGRRWARNFSWSKTARLTREALHLASLNQRRHLTPRG